MPIHPTRLALSISLIGTLAFANAVASEVEPTLPIGTAQLREAKVRQVLGLTEDAGPKAKDAGAQRSRPRAVRPTGARRPDGGDALQWDAGALGLASAAPAAPAVDVAVRTEDDARIRAILGIAAQAEDGTAARWSARTVAVASVRAPRMTPQGGPARTGAPAAGAERSRGTFDASSSAIDTPPGEAMSATFASQLDLPLATSDSPADSVADLLGTGPGHRPRRGQDDPAPVFADRLALPTRRSAMWTPASLLLRPDEAPWLGRDTFDADAMLRRSTLTSDAPPSNDDPLLGLLAVLRDDGDGESVATAATPAPADDPTAAVFAQLVATLERSTAPGLPASTVTRTFVEPSFGGEAAPAIDVAAELAVREATPAGTDVVADDADAWPWTPLAADAAPPATADPRFALAVAPQTAERPDDRIARQPLLARATIAPAAAWSGHAMIDLQAPWPDTAPRRTAADPVKVAARHEPRVTASVDIFDPALDLPRDGDDRPAMFEARAPQTPGGGDGTVANRAKRPADDAASSLVEAAMRSRRAFDAERGRAEAANDRRVPGGVAIALNDAQLDAMRGGFETDAGLKISFGIERAVYINGSLVTTTRLNVDDLSRLSGAHATSNALERATVGVLQSGAGNGFSPGQVNPSSVATVIQNSLNNQQIQGITQISATVNSLDLVRRSDVQSSIQSALADSIRR